MKPSTLFLGHGFDITNKQHQALLVHELTHHLQNKNNITFPCSQLYEPEAYEMMKIWSLKNKISYEGPSDFTIMARFGQCPDE